MKKHPSAPLRVEVVWLPVLVGDSQQFIDRRVLSDPRVAYYWDPHRVVGQWFSSHVTQQPDVTWDAFFLYGAPARWEATPGPLIASGSSIIGSTDELQNGFDQVEAGRRAYLAFDRLMLRS